jgi:eukaryotic-like serine/threonine-protein kinase
MKSRGAKMYSVAWSRGGTRIATGGSDGIVHLFEPASAREAMSLHGHVSRVTSLQFSYDDVRLLSTSTDGTIRIWDAGAREGMPDAR